jgi:hypothetical protein
MDSASLSAPLPPLWSRCPLFPMDVERTVSSRPLFTISFITPLPATSWGWILWERSDCLSQDTNPDALYHVSVTSLAPCDQLVEWRQDTEWRVFLLPAPHWSTQVARAVFMWLPDGVSRPTPPKPMPSRRSIRTQPQPTLSTLNPSWTAAPSWERSARAKDGLQRREVAEVVYCYSKTSQLGRARRWEMRTKYWSKDLNGGDRSEDVDVGERIILKWMLRKRGAAWFVLFAQYC